LGEGLRRDYDEEAQGPYNGYDDEDDEAHRNALPSSQSKLEESNCRREHRRHLRTTTSDESKTGSYREGDGETR
jgi:hypothetical protein